MVIENPLNICEICGKRKGGHAMTPKERAHHEQHCVPILLEQREKAKKRGAKRVLADRHIDYLSKVGKE